MTQMGLQQTKYDVTSIPSVGLHWEYEGVIAPKVTTINESVKNKFQTPNESVMMMCPIHVREAIVLETNKYADQK
jgi:hypothetical protein